MEINGVELEGMEIKLADIKPIDLKWYQNSLRDCFWCGESYRNQKILSIRELSSIGDVRNLRLYVLCPKCNEDYTVGLEIRTLYVKKET